MTKDDNKLNSADHPQATDINAEWDDFIWDENEWDPTDWDELAQAEDPQTTDKSRGVRRFFLGFVSIMLALSLIGTSLAVYPQLFSVASFNFIKNSLILSKEEQVKEYKKSVVIVKTEKGKGTGFFYGDSNLVVTNHHVIADGGQISIITNSGSAAGAKIIASDAKQDYAILQVANLKEEIPILPQASERTIGEDLYIIGNPLFNSFIVSSGVYLGEYEHSDKTSLVIRGKFYKGNSGSPIMNLAGEVIGVLYATTKVIIDGQEFDAALAVPIEVIDAALTNQ